MKTLIRTSLAATMLASHSLAFAAADKGAGANGGASAGLPGNASAPAAAATPVAAGAILPIRKAGSFELPAKTSKSGRGGGKSPYPFDQLEIGDSFGVAGKTKKNFNSIVYGANQRYLEKLFEADGTTPKMVDKIDRTTKVVTKVQATRPTRIFEAFDVDPAKHDGASVLIVRQPLPAAATN